jgi:plastocyanin
MTRRIGTLLAATLVGWLMVPAGAALAGGGCHTVSQGTGDTVEMVDACFTPSTLRIDPGDSVTFVNRDDITHNVGAAQWGNYDDMNLNDSFTATFDESGVYSFACSYHPGMTGAFVVGDGTGAGSGEVVTSSSTQEDTVATSPVVEIRTVTEESSATPVTVGWIVGGLVGLAIGVGIGTLVRRRERSAA